MAMTMWVNLPLDEVLKTVQEEVVGGSITGELTDVYTLPGPHGSRCVTMVFEKHYYRAGNRLTLTLVADDFTAPDAAGYCTRVHLVGGGGGSGLLKFDWGAAGSFEDAVAGALDPKSRAAPTL